jgi:hypothetical protein
VNNLDYYKDEYEIEAVVSGFEECTTAQNKFNHLSHLTVAVYYLRQSTPDQALLKMRSGLFRFLDHQGIDRAKYQEELTRKWIALVQCLLEETNPGDSLLTITNKVIERLGDSRLVT